jgi:hypothetical protein
LNNCDLDARLAFTGSGGLVPWYRLPRRAHLLGHYQYRTLIFPNCPVEGSKIDDSKNSLDVGLLPVFFDA